MRTTDAPAAANARAVAAPTRLPNVDLLPRIKQTNRVKIHQGLRRPGPVCEPGAGRALFTPHSGAEKPNLARCAFLVPRARDFYADWPRAPHDRRDAGTPVCET
ncbi:hypothetical protein GCM10010517_79510 [Streptosporangium fragile]|uniref:Excalibur calcium-binding domain-containing protein n=1 Tax=Streptosporangium fragile TaxID=46186 RepID=A0ABP6IXE9_9ACTN